MSDRGWFYGLARGVVFVLGLGGMPAWSAEPADQTMVLLKAAQEAAQHLDYSGVYTYQQGTSMQSSRIVHVVDGMGERERLEALDGEPREHLKQNGIVQCLLPRQKLILIEPHRSDRFPGVLLGAGEQIPRHYRFHREPTLHRVAGRECSMTELQARDDLRYGYRYCIDTQTHLILQAQTLDAHGQVIDQVVFNSLAVGKGTTHEGLKSRWDTRDWRILEPAIEPVDLLARGWRITYPEGFVPLAEISRLIRPEHKAEQLVLSDGLAAISVFIETFDPERDQTVKQGAMSQGAMNIYRRRVAAYWLTAIGEVPAQTVRDVAEAVEYVPLAAH
ncbi:MucB/RseB C-terminal domain-containing protein [Alcaligenaceae bacterium CGII-47]|nr:MucB/RseB C-terminal domain-containing protein [Alcaligenaceae bacterium CGII-47]